MGSKKSYSSSSKYYNPSYNSSSSTARTETTRHQHNDDQHYHRRRSGHEHEHNHNHGHHRSREDNARYLSNASFAIGNYVQSRDRLEELRVNPLHYSSSEETARRYGIQDDTNWARINTRHGHNRNDDFASSQLNDCKQGWLRRINNYFPEETRWDRPQSGHSNDQYGSGRGSHRTSRYADHLDLDSDGGHSGDDRREQHRSGGEQHRRNNGGSHRSHHGSRQH